MATEPSRLEKVFDYITGINTWKQALIFILLGAALLLGTMLYQHPQWLENIWRYRHGLELH